MDEHLDNIASLATKGTRAKQVEKRVLLGKLVSSRLFQKQDLVQIISNVWKTKDRVKMEHLSDNLFKLYFTSKEDRDAFFNRRTWSFNDSHMILKLWLNSKRSPLKPLSSLSKFTNCLQVYCIRIMPN